MLVLRHLVASEMQRLWRCVRPGDLKNEEEDVGGSEMVRPDAQNTAFAQPKWQLNGQTNALRIDAYKLAYDIWVQDVADPKLVFWAS